MIKAFLLSADREVSKDEAVGSLPKANRDNGERPN